MPREKLGLIAGALSREERAAAAASEGSLAYGFFSADYSGGTAADFHGLPRCPCLQIENRVYVAHRSVSTRQQITTQKFVTPSLFTRISFQTIA
jgi:hypothetical protein